MAYPNPTDPLNGDAAALYLHKPVEFNKKCRGKFYFLIFHCAIFIFIFVEYVLKFANDEALSKYCPDTDGPNSSQKNKNLHNKAFNSSIDASQQISDSESTISDFSEDETKGMEL